MRFLKNRTVLGVLCIVLSLISFSIVLRKVRLSPLLNKRFSRWEGVMSASSSNNSL